MVVMMEMNPISKSVVLTKCQMYLHIFFALHFTPTKGSNFAELRFKLIYVPYVNILRIFI